MCLFDLKAHQLDRAGPRRALDQELHCVSRQTPKMQPEEIQPLMIDITRGFVKSNSGPFTMSKAREAKPERCKARETFPRPANNSKNNLLGVRVATDRARRKCFLSLSCISPGERVSFPVGPGKVRLEEEAVTRVGAGVL